MLRNHISTTFSPRQKSYSSNFVNREYSIPPIPYFIEICIGLPLPRYTSNMRLYSTICKNTKLVSAFTLVGFNPSLTCKRAVLQLYLSFSAFPTLLMQLLIGQDVMTEYPRLKVDMMNELLTMKPVNKQFTWQPRVRWS